MAETKVLSPGKKRLFTAITFLFPFLLLAAVEVTLRVVGYGSSFPLFEGARRSPQYRQPSATVGKRYFPFQQHSPRPSTDSFLVRKPAHSFRVFALGESSTAGFPYSTKGAFTRIVAAQLRDALPNDTVEVVNLGIEATNSYAVADFAGEILDEHPDAILIYSGHNEYYGAPGVGSLGRVASYPWLVRSYLKLQRLRTLQLLRNATKGIAGRARPVGDAQGIELAARDQMIELGDQSYQRGVAQLEKNLTAAIGKFRGEGVPVFIGSLVSNLRDQRPLAALSTGGNAGKSANGSFDEAQQELAAGGQENARKLFMRARDLDEVRFRAPTDFNAVIQRVAKRNGATYVPIEEEFSRASQSGIPGHDLILEHVHPNSRGYALMGRTFFDAIRSSGVLKTRADFSRLRPADYYERGVGITADDERAAAAEVKKVTSRWPFVPITTPRLH